MCWPVVFSGRTRTLCVLPCLAYEVLGLKSKVSHILRMHSPTEVHPQPCEVFVLRWVLRSPGRTVVTLPSVDCCKIAHPASVEV